MKLLAVSLVFSLAADTVTTDPLGGWGTLVQYGIVGLVALAFITNKWHSDGEFKAVVADRDLAREEATQARTEIALLRQRMEDHLLALVRATEAMAQVEVARSTKARAR